MALAINFARLTDKYYVFRIRQEPAAACDYLADTASWAYAAISRYVTTQAGKEWLIDQIIAHATRHFRQVPQKAVSADFFSQLTELDRAAFGVTLSVAHQPFAWCEYVTKDAEGSRRRSRGDVCDNCFLVLCNLAAHCIKQEFAVKSCPGFTLVVLDGPSATALTKFSRIDGSAFPQSEVVFCLMHR
jgi:hypothetical protein